MVILFFDRRGLIQHEFFRPTSDIRNRYSVTLKHLQAHIARVRLEMLANNTQVPSRQRFAKYYAEYLKVIPFEEFQECFQRGRSGDGPNALALQRKYFERDHNNARHF